MLLESINFHNENNINTQSTAVSIYLHIQVKIHHSHDSYRDHLPIIDSTIFGDS